MKCPYPEEEGQARVMCGDPIAVAFEWIRAYVENLNDRFDTDDGDPLTIEELIDTAMSHVDNSSSWGGEYIVRGGAFEGFDMDPTFWDKLADLKQINIPQDRRNSFFSCSC